ncbi:MAG: hypothetical protein ABW215_23480 [Kibdelosporangium sp.]
MTDNDRAMGVARVEWAELLFNEAPDVTSAHQPGSELTAQVQASVFLAIYYELRHGNDQMAAYTRALEEHRAAMLSYGDELSPAMMAPPPPLPGGLSAMMAQGGQPKLPPAREPMD